MKHTVVFLLFALICLTGFAQKRKGYKKPEGPASEYQLDPGFKTNVRDLFLRIPIDFSSIPDSIEEYYNVSIIIGTDGVLKKTDFNPQPSEKLNEIVQRQLNNFTASIPMIDSKPVEVNIYFGFLVSNNTFARELFIRSIDSLGRRVPEPHEFTAVESEPVFTNKKQIANAIFLQSGLMNPSTEQKAIMRTLVSPEGKYIYAIAVRATGSEVIKQTKKYLPQSTFSPAIQATKPVYFWATYLFTSKEVE